MRKWDRYCVRCFWNLEDADVRCRHCGQDYVKLHIRITAIHKKDSRNRKDRKLWIGKTGEFIIDTDFKDIKNSEIEAGWYAGYFIPDESPTETWLQNAIQFIEV